MDLVKAMLKVLADCYSQTAKYMLKAMESGSEEYWRLANREYIAESFVRTGLLPNGYADEDLRRRIAKAQRRKIRDKNPWDKELALHYYAKHYNTMTPKELSAALTVATKKRITRANASRRRQRLGLVSANREGRPDWKRYKT